MKSVKVVLPCWTLDYFVYGQMLRFKVFVSSSCLWKYLSMFQQSSPAEPGSAYERRWQQAAVEEVSPVLGLSRFSVSRWLTKPYAHQTWIHSKLYTLCSIWSIQNVTMKLMKETKLIIDHYNYIQLSNEKNPRCLRYIYISGIQYTTTAMWGLF